MDPIFQLPQVLLNQNIVSSATICKLIGGFRFPMKLLFGLIRFHAPVGWWKCLKMANHYYFNVTIYWLSVFQILIG